METPRNKQKYARIYIELLALLYKLVVLVERAAVCLAFLLHFLNVSILNDFAILIFQEGNGNGKEKRGGGHAATYITTNKARTTAASAFACVDCPKICCAGKPLL